MTQSPPMTVGASVEHDISGPLREVPVDHSVRLRAEHEIGRFRIAGPDIEDSIVQSGPVPSAATASGLNFAGVGNGDYGFTPNAAPPDTNGVVGTTQYVQWVNESFAVFDKTTGAIANGFPKQGNAPWANFIDSGTGTLSRCATANDGDPIVQFDKAAQRWILTQFVVSSQPFLQCVAVSTTSDATGAYARYSFQYANFPDYPKLSVWPDAYYISFNIFSNTFLGGLACAYDRSAMLAGAATATQICFGPTSTFASPLPSDLDGSTAPPAGSPAFFVNLQTTTTLNLFKFHVNFQTPSASTFTGPIALTVPGFAVACANGSPCIPQVDTRQQLDGLSDRLMYRLAYRNFGDHETIVATHSVSTGRKNPAGVRWYELRSPGTGTFSLFQSGTFAPDARSRWMGSVAMDKVGDIAVGYSLSSSTTHPAVGYATRTAADPAGTLGNEVIVKQGAGSQLSNLSRWGDYSAMTIDPVDDCTFWFTSEYLKANGTFNWSTQIASFKVVGCQ
ncbi:MAG TPA: hypothetical protein VFT22_17820 [Kofleriaceae bacterium]|nr:hypothetical protein [Kofleriaceae bacterium]